MDQLVLPMPEKPPQDVDHGLIQKLPSMTSSIMLCTNLSGYANDKPVYQELQIDPGHWARIKKGEAHFPNEKYIPLMKLCGNEAPALWMANALNWDLNSIRRKESVLEQENRLLREQLAEERKKNELTLSIVSRINGGG